MWAPVLDQGHDLHLFIDLKVEMCSRALLLNGSISGPPEPRGCRWTPGWERGPTQGPLGDTRLPYLSTASHHTPSGLRVLESKGQIQALPPGDLGELGRIMGNFLHLQSGNDCHHRHLWSHCDTKQSNLLGRPSVGLAQQGHWCPAG